MPRQTCGSSFTSVLDVHPAIGWFHCKAVRTYHCFLEMRAEFDVCTSNCTPYVASSYFGPPSEVSTSCQSGRSGTIPVLSLARIKFYANFIIQANSHAGIGKATNGDSDEAPLLG